MHEKWQPLPRVDLGNGVQLDRGAGSIITEKGEVFLSPLQSSVFTVLWEYKGDTVPHKVLGEQVWGYDDKKVVNKLIKRLRKKVKPIGINVETLPGKGIRLK